MPTLYRVYVNRQVQGPYDLDEISKIENLSKETLVCEDGDLEWEVIGKCRSIQRQLAMQPLKWGAIQKIVLDVSTKPPQNPGQGRTVSTSGDFVLRKREKSQKNEKLEVTPEPTKKKSIFSKIFDVLNGDI